MRPHILALLVCSIASAPFPAGASEPCGEIFPDLQDAFLRTRNFRSACPKFKKHSPTANLDVTKFDPTGKEPPYKYVFDYTGKCLVRFPVGYGAGVKKGQPSAVINPLPGVALNSRLTPEGMHMLAPVKPGSKFSGTLALLEVGLQQQGSEDRDIYVHQVDNPGNPVTEGCSGLSAEDLKEYRKYMGPGDIVYNYFGLRAVLILRSGADCEKPPDNQAFRKTLDDVQKLEFPEAVKDQN